MIDQGPLALQPPSIAAEAPVAEQHAMARHQHLRHQSLVVEGDLCDGRALEAVVQRLLAKPQVAYLHAHYAKPGCYAARIERA